MNNTIFHLGDPHGRRLSPSTGMPLETLPRQADQPARDSYVPGLITPLPTWLGVFPEAHSTPLNPALIHTPLFCAHGH